MQVNWEPSAVMTFSAKDDWGMETPHEDALVIEVIIHNFEVQKVLIDNGNKVNLLLYQVF